MKLIVTTAGFDREPNWLFGHGITGYWRTAGQAPPSRRIVIEGSRAALTAARTDPQVESWQTYTKVEEAV